MSEAQIKMNETDALGQGSVGKLLFRLAAPSIAAQVINVLYSLVDRMYIGHIEGVGKQALTGVGVCLPLIMIITAFAALVSMGAAPRASIFLGKGDKESAEKTLGGSVTMLLISSIALTVVFQLFSEPMLLQFGASENTIGYALDYLLIYTLGTIFVQLTLGLNAFISAQGFAKVSMVTVLVGAVCNIILDPVFIFVLDMGVKGAAIATVISQCVSAVWIVLFLCGKKTTLRIQLKYLKPEKDIVLPALALGLAPFIMQLTESVLAVCFNSSLYKYGDDLAVGAMTILSSCMQLSMLPLMGLAQGAQPIISYNYGANNSQRVKKAFKLLLITCLTYSMLFWLAVQLFPGAFIRIFNDDSALLAFTAPALRLYMLCSGIFGIQLACQQAFISLGNAKSSLTVAVVRKIVLLIPLIYIMPATGLFAEKTTAVFAAEPVADFISVVFTALLFSSQFKKAIARMEGTEDEYRVFGLYRFLRGVVRIFFPKMKTVWETPFSGRPAVFVCNHDRAYGPIAMCGLFEMYDQIRPWINAQVLSVKEMPKYVRSDFWWPQNKWYTKILDHTVAYLVAPILPGVLRGSRCIPVYHDASVMATLKESMKYLSDGRPLLLFPEHPCGFQQYEEKLFDGFVSVGRLMYSRKKEIVDFYPTFVDWDNREIYVGSPISYDPEIDYKEQTVSIPNAIAQFYAEHKSKALTR